DLGADVGADAVDGTYYLGVALVDVGVVAEHSRCGHVEDMVLIGGAGVGHGHGGVVDAGDGDDDRGAGGGALAVDDGVAEGVGGGLADLEVLDLAVGVVGVAAVGVDALLGAVDMSDLRADVAGDAVDLGHGLGVALVHIGVVAEHTWGGHVEDVVLIGGAGVGHGHGGVVEDGEGDGEGGGGGGGRAVDVGVAEGVGGGVTEVEILELSIGVVGVAAVGVDGELGARGQGDLGADVGADAVDLGHGLGVALIDISVVAEDARGGHVEDVVLIGGAGVGHGHGGVV